MKRELRVTDADYLNFECKIGKPLKLKILPFTSNLPAILKIPKPFGKSFFITWEGRGSGIFVKIVWSSSETGVTISGH